MNKYLFYNQKNTMLLFSLPAYIYWIYLALQYNVGTDYFSYYNMIIDGIQPHIENNNEYLFYFILKFIQYFNLNPQFIFVITGFLNTILFFIVLKKYMKYGFKPWLLFYLFMTITTIYFNQMNALRQFISVMIVPILVIYLYEKKYIKSLITATIGMMFHFSFIIPIFFLFLFQFVKRTNKNILLFFLVVPLILLFIFPHIFDYIVNAYFSNYQYFLLREKLHLSNFLTKLYYIPLFLYFLYLWNFKKILRTVDITFMYTLIIIFSATYSLYLIDFTINLGGRVFQYFIFFYVFPLYYVVEYKISKKKPYQLIMIFLYILLPYLVKTLMFPIGEYDYNSVLGL